MEVKRHKFVKESVFSENDAGETIEVVPVEIASGSLNEIAGLLNNLYQDGPLAVFREYLTNAADSMRMAGTFSSRPIEVHIGSSKEPFKNWKGEIKATKKYQSYSSTEWSHTLFQVKDYGTGMSLDDLKNVYSKYGASTKKGNILTVGEFGVGAKSALSLTEYFEIISVKDGEKVIATIERDTTTNISAMFIKNVSPTSEPNGFTVRIPLENQYSYSVETLAKRFFYSWPANSVTVNGETPAGLGLFNSSRYITVPGVDGEPVGWVEPLTNEQYESLRLSSEWGKPMGPNGVSYREKLPTVFIGGVPYDDKVFNQIIHDTPYAKLGYRIHLNVPNGMLTLTPNREGIKYTDENKNIITGHLNNLLSLLPQVFEEHLNSLDYKNAVKFRNWNAYPLNQSLDIDEGDPKETPFVWGKNSLAKYYYQGELMPTTVDFKELYPGVEVEIINTTKYQHLVSGTKVNKINLINLGSNRLPVSDTYTLNISTTHVGKYFPLTIFNQYKPLNIIVHGVYKGSAKNPIRAYLPNAMKQLGHTKPGGYVVIHIPADVEIPDVLAASATETFTYERMVDLHTQYRKENHRPRTVKPKETTKTVNNSPYFSFKTISDGTVEVELWQRGEVKEYTGDAIWVKEEKLLRFKRTVQGQALETLRTSLKGPGPQPNLADLAFMEPVAKAFPGKHIFVVPKPRSELVFNEHETIKPVDKVAKELWDTFDETKQRKIAFVHSLAHESSTFRSLKPESYDVITNLYTQEAISEIVDKTEIYNFASLPTAVVMEWARPALLSRVADFNKYDRVLYRVPVELWNKMLELVPFLNENPTDV